MAELKLINLEKSFGDYKVVRNVDITVKDGEFVTLLGPSGCGKTTTLRMIAGFTTPTSGSILLDDVPITSVDQKIFLPPEQRDMGMVFQSYAVWPHMNIFQNVAYPLRFKKMSKQEMQEKVMHVLSLVKLDGLAERMPDQLSGGQQQRVALARALAIRPRLLMFDEPLSSLDRTLKDEVLDELRHILHETRIPAVYVTHDQEEAFTIADRILLLHDGRIVREGTPAEVWSHPGSAWAARFLNVGNVVEGVISEKRKVTTPFGVVDLQCGHQHKAGERVGLLLKPSSTGRLTINAKVEDVLFQREQFKVELRGGLFILMKDAPQVGESIAVTFDVECLSHD